MRIERAKATRKNLKVLLCLIAEASTWLRTKDTDQWAEPWPTKKERDARLRQDLRDGKTWIVWDGKNPAATVTIAEQPNEYVWSASECDLFEPAVYVHRLITARNYAGWGLGAELVDWAGLRGQHLNKAKWIRIDVWFENAALHQYYTKRGFRPCGRCADPDYPSGALFQKPVSDIRESTIPRVDGSRAEFDMFSLRAARHDLVGSRDGSSIPARPRQRSSQNHLEDMVLLPRAGQRARSAWQMPWSAP
jgi:GNAT superfamily N-acetyltransferase